ncbi:ribosomal protein S10 [Striga asiatica]|uniref:Ribosomal protein S10 n=1 Tax=Striga asiatica TaxID=4170 RepID=A0A5A7PZJ0_STRAF|nr:ribosomal protein S10 [Striga asiatica]
MVLSKLETSNHPSSLQARDRRFNHRNNSSSCVGYGRNFSAAKEAFSFSLYARSLTELRFARSKQGERKRLKVWDPGSHSISSYGKNNGSNRIGSRRGDNTNEAKFRLKTWSGRKSSERCCILNSDLEVRRIENKVANGCVTRGNLPNSSGQILNQAKKRCLMSLRSIRLTKPMMLSWSFRTISHTGTETRPGLPRGAAVGNLGQWAKARSSNIA